MYPTVTDKQVFEQFIPVAPLPEQKRIADTINHRMAKQERARTAVLEQLNAVESLRTSLLRDAFDGAV